MGGCGSGAVSAGKSEDESSGEGERVGSTVHRDRQTEMWKKNKGDWVSVRPLGKHTRTSEEGSKDVCVHTGKRIRDSQKKRWRKEGIHKLRRCPV
jgi:hypothetical protein